MDRTLSGFDWPDIADDLREKWLHLIHYFIMRAFKVFSQSEV